jgi:hypothetical protein
MTNPRTIDRRDVAHTTNPVGEHEHIEEIDKPNRARPLDATAAKLPAGGGDAAVTGMPRETLNEQPGAGMPHKIPPAKSGQSAEEATPATPNQSNPGRLGQTDGGETAHVQSPRPAD